MQVGGHPNQIDIAFQDPKYRNLSQNIIKEVNQTLEIRGLPKVRPKF